MLCDCSYSDDDSSFFARQRAKSDRYIWMITAISLCSIKGVDERSEINRTAQQFLNIPMRYMITGGNQGLGLHLCQIFDGDSFSRTNDYDISKDKDRLAKLSLGYDVVINNAYDHSFGQTELLNAMALLWRDQGKSGYIINIGGVGSEDLGAPFPGWEHYNAHKRALKHQSLQWTEAYRQGRVMFRTSLLTLDRLDTPKGRGTPQWTGNGVNLDDVVEMVRLCVGIQPNTCLGEIKAWVNLDYQN